MQPHLRHSFRLTYGRMAPSLVNWYSGPTRNRKFESISLQRGVRCEPGFRGQNLRCGRLPQADDSSSPPKVSVDSVMLMRRIAIATVEIRTALPSANSGSPGRCDRCQCRRQQHIDGLA